MNKNRGVNWQVVHNYPPERWVYLDVQKRSMQELGRLSAEEFQKAPKWPLVLILDNVRSLSNVGSLMRSADAFLVECVYLCGITGTPPHRDITKTAIGAEKSVRWEYRSETEQAIQELKQQGFRVWALEQTHGSIPLHETQLTHQPTAFVLGHEIDGVSQQALALCDGAIEIPQFGSKHSLNVAVSGGMALWEFARQSLSHES